VPQKELPLKKKQFKVSIKMTKIRNMVGILDKVHIKLYPTVIRHLRNIKDLTAVVKKLKITFVIMWLRLIKAND
jgi:hypothetical protein